MNVNRHEIPPVFFKFPRLMHVLWAMKFVLYPRVAVVHRQLKSCNFKGLRVLDLGSGDGQFLFPIAASGPVSMDAVDLSGSNLRFTKALLPLVNTHGVGIPTFLSQADTAHYDFIQCISTLQYLEDPDAIIKNIYRVLARDGRFLLYVPLNQFQEFFLYRWIFNRFSNYESTMQRKRIFSLGEIYEYLEIAGFKIESFTPTYGWFGRWSHELLSIGSILISQSNWRYKIMGLLWVLQFLSVILTLNFLEWMFPPNARERFNGGMFVCKL